MITKQIKNRLPFGEIGVLITLPSVLEPVADLGRCQIGVLGESTLILRRWISKREVKLVAYQSNFF